MRILFDHCVPKPFRREFPTHTVHTTAQMSWEDLKNGDLLAAAQGHFDVFLTVDKNIRYQQSLQSLPLSVLILDVERNTPEALAPFAPFVERVLSTLRHGQMIQIDVNGNATEITPGQAP